MITLSHKIHIFQLLRPQKIHYRKKKSTRSNYVVKIHMNLIWNIMSSLILQVKVQKWKYLQKSKSTFTFKNKSLHNIIRII